MPSNQYPWNSSLWGGSAPQASTGTIKILKIIITAYRIAGIVPRPIGDISPEEKEEGLYALNSLLDNWKLDRNLAYAIVRTLFTLQAGKASYTIGIHPDSTAAAADIATARPVRIDQASFVLTTVTPNIEMPLDVLNDQQWQALSPKSQSGSIPTKLHYVSDYPYGTLEFWQVPTVANQMALYLWKSISEFSTVADPVLVAPGVRLALEYNLAVHLAERFPDRQQITATAVNRARTSLMDVKRANAPSLLMRCESAALGVDANQGRYNIFNNGFDNR